jgi:hypothetical protein
MAIAARTMANTLRRNAASGARRPLTALPPLRPSPSLGGAFDRESSGAPLRITILETPHFEASLAELCHDLERQDAVGPA